LKEKLDKHEKNLALDMLELEGDGDQDCLVLE
jgi:hypothetical protein